MPFDSWLSNVHFSFPLARKRPVRSAALALVTTSGGATETLEFYREQAERMNEELTHPADRVVAADAMVALRALPWQEACGFCGRQYRADDSGIMRVDPEDAPPLERAGFVHVDAEKPNPA